LKGSRDAYDLYLQARYHWTEYSLHSRFDSPRAGRNLLKPAVRKDPSFAQAHALLSMFFHLEGANFSANMEGNIRRAEEATPRAIRVNPNLPDGHIALDGVYAQSGRNGEAIQTLRRALSLAPNSPDAFDHLGYVHHYAGLNELAEEAYRRTIQLNPTVPRTPGMHARMLLHLGKAAAAECGKARSVFPTSLKSWRISESFFTTRGSSMRRIKSLRGQWS
jgi:tetratricopeptide (TPR) repeat protein